MCYSNSLGSNIFKCRQLKVKKREGRLWILFVWMFQLKCWKISRSFWCFLHVMLSSWSWSVLLETVGFTVNYVQNIHHADTSTESERCAELYGGNPHPPMFFIQLWWSSLCMDFKVGDRISDWTICYNLLLTSRLSTFLHFYFTYKNR